MNSNKRLKIVVKRINKSMSYTNEDISIALGYKAKNYVSDIIGGAKPINEFFLERLEKNFKVNPEYIKFDKKPEFFESNKSDNQNNYPDDEEVQNSLGEHDHKYLSEKLTDAQRIIKAQEQIIELQKQLLKNNKSEPIKKKDPEPNNLKREK